MNDATMMFVNDDYTKILMDDGSSLVKLGFKFYVYV